MFEKEMCREEKKQAYTFVAEMEKDGKTPKSGIG